MKPSINRTTDRIKQTGEVFTPLPLVDEILDKLPEEVWTDPSKTFIDNSCGDGNFLVRVLARKLKYHPTKLFEAVSTIYGVDLMPDNINQCRERLFGELFKHARETNQNKTFLDRGDDIWEIITQNVVCHDALTYHYRFDGTDDLTVITAE